MLDRVTIVVEYRGDAVEHLVEPRDDQVGARRIVNARRAVRDRARRDRRMIPVVAGHDLEVLLAEHAAGVDEELGIAADAVAYAIFDPRRDAHLHAVVDLRVFFAADELYRFDLADFDPRDLHRRTGLERADVAEVDVELEPRVQREVAED